jgi:F-type H+-transporting ATPase subunit b
MHTTSVQASNFLIPNGTFFVELFAFLVVLGVLWRYVVPPVRKAVSDRQEMIRSQLDEGRQASERLKRAEVDYKETLDQARTIAASIRDQARADANTIREEILAQAAQERERVLATGREQLATERQALARELRADLGGLAVELASRILGESLAEEARQRGTVQRFLSELKDEPATGAIESTGAKTAGSR